MSILDVNGRGLRAASRASAALLLLIGIARVADAQAGIDSVFDVHLHIGSTAASRAGIAAMMDSMHVRRAMYIGTQAELEAAAIPAGSLRGLMFPCEGGRAPNSGARCFADGAQFPDTAWLRRAVMRGDVDVFGELTGQYWNVAADDPRLEPYFSLAEELNVPVGIHLGIGPPGVAYAGSGFPPRKSPNYRGAAGDPLSLEAVLVRHPRLRVYAMHAGWPFLDDMTYMLNMHPNLYADLSVLQFAIPRAAFYTYLKTLMDAGFGRRLMWGSDGGARFMKDGVLAIQEAPFLSEEQKRDILYANAARFFARPTPKGS